MQSVCHCRSYGTVIGKVFTNNKTISSEYIEYRGNYPVLSKFQIKSPKQSAAENSNISTVNLVAFNQCQNITKNILKRAAICKCDMSKSVPAV